MSPCKIWHARVPNLSIRKIKIKLTLPGLLSKAGNRLEFTVMHNSEKCDFVTVTLDDNNKVTGFTVETDRFLKPEQTTNNFRNSLISK